MVGSNATSTNRADRLSQTCGDNCVDDRRVQIMGDLSVLFGFSYFDRLDAKGTGEYVKSSVDD